MSSLIFVLNYTKVGTGLGYVGLSPDIDSCVLHQFDHFNIYGHISLGKLQVETQRNFTYGLRCGAFETQTGTVRLFKYRVRSLTIDSG